MKCMFCNKTATVHLTDIVNKTKREAHLCERCARERNLLPEPPGPQIDLKALLNLMMVPPGTKSVPAATVAGAGEACPVCGMTYAAFKAEGRFGCARDYDAFLTALEPLLERVHRATVHVGKRPVAVQRAERAAELTGLRARLRAAIGAEDYEEAARLRDRIRTMETEAEGTSDEPR